MIISLIAAMATNRTIGNKNTIPWEIPEDLKRFKEITMGHTIIMGRKTCESIGRPLPERTNIVITRRKFFFMQGFIMVSSIESALLHCPEHEDEVFICGGEQIYTKALEFADRIYLTLIHREITGDTYFPEFSANNFKKIRSNFFEKSEPHTFMLFERIKN